ncbi:MAG: cyclase family protein [Proteobacteria bacterium]|nr:cyclase family protein [Pseudomonadota bacterium]
MPKIIDISPPLTPDIAVWPGDVPFSRSVACSIAEGANLDLSSITTTVHVGAHTDAPSHYKADGSGIGARSLQRYYGRCQVMRVSVGRGERVLPSHLTAPLREERLLIRTDSFPNPNQFNTDFAALSPALVDFAHSAGVRLLGLDTPSVDLCDDKALLSHTAIASHDMAILEGVVLSHVEDGLYTLIALPLNLPGVDASPVRAVLVADL